MAGMTVANKAGDNGWRFAHNDAVNTLEVYGKPGKQQPHEIAVVMMLKGWAVYAEAHRKAFDSPIGEDYVLGPEWRAVGLGIRGLLNGVTGRLDCGTLDAFILDTLKENGFDVEAL